MTRLSTIALAASLLLSGGLDIGWAQAPADEPPDFRHQPVWCGFEHACFLSEEVLGTTPVDDLPLSESQKDSLRNILENPPVPPHPIERWVNRECFGARESSRPAGSHPEATTLEELLADQQTVTLVAVRDVVAGWSLARHSVGELVEVEIVEVLRDRTESLRQGARLVYLNLGGEFYYRSRRICAFRGTKLYLPRPGDVLLLAAAHSGGDSYYLGKRLVFPIAAGQVLAQPYSLLADQRPRSLAEIRSFLLGLK